MTQAGPAIPVLPVTDRSADGGPALRVAVVSDGRPTEGGPARAVIVVTDGRPTQGNEPLPVVLATGAQAAGVIAGNAIPVVVVSGSLNLNSAPTNTVLPSISGIALPGQTLSATTGTWTGTPAPTFTYQWKRNGVNIGGATNSTYLVVEADDAQAITVTVTATNVAGSASATSAATNVPTFLLRDVFTTNAGAPLASPRTCEPGPGTLTLVQTDGQLSIVANQLTFPAQATPVFGDQGLFMIGGLARVCGRILLGTVNLTTRSNAFVLGWCRTAKVPTGFADCAEFAFLSGATSYATCNNAQASALPIFSLVFNANGVYDVAVVLRKGTQAQYGTLRGGALYCIRGGLFGSTWTLVYPSVPDTTATVFPSHGNFASAGAWANLSAYDLTGALATLYGAARYLAQPADGQTMGAVASDGTWEATWLPIAGETFDFSVRRVDDNNRWIIRSDQAGSTIKIFEKNAGVETQRGTSAQTWTVTSIYRIIVSAAGTTIEVRVENLTSTPGIADLRTSYASASFQQTATGMAVSGSNQLRDLAAWPRALDPTGSPTTYSDLAAANSITLRSPKPFQVVQRSGASNTLLITGNHNVAGAQSIEASWNGGAYSTIATGVVPGPFSGSLTGLSAGQGTLNVRIVATPSIITSATSVGIGDVFVIAGQSNAQGQGTNSQAYTGTAGLLTMFGIDYVCRTGADPIGTTLRSADAVLSTASGGSVWPLVATSFVTSQGVPIMLLPAAQGATAIAAWQASADKTDRSTLYGQMHQRILQQPNGIKCVLWWQGEADATAGQTQAYYFGQITTLAAALNADWGVKLMPCKLQNCSGIGAPNQAAINAAIGQAWATNTTTTLAGPDLTGINTAPEDTLHLKTDAKLASAAALWWSSLQAAFGYA